jgi:hypothetical protein
MAMKHTLDRREFLKLAGLGSVVLVSGCSSLGHDMDAQAQQDFFFVQLSDSHWGFSGAEVNPDARGTLPKAVAAVNALSVEPDFIMFTGDLTHSTDDAAERHRRLAEFREIAGQLKAPLVHTMPGEHDAALDRGEAYRAFFGATHYAFDHKGVHFIVLDNVSDPTGAIGAEQLAWLKDDLAKQDQDARIVVFTHRPLFHLYPRWGWATPDGDAAIALLMPYRNVTVFYGHIHQEHHHMTGHIAHHAAHSLMFALSAPGSQPKNLPVPWDPAAPYRGLGYRRVDAEARSAAYRLTELPILKG